jgi:hypothetical protein
VRVGWTAGGCRQEDQEDVGNMNRPSCHAPTTQLGSLGFYKGDL